MLFRILCFLFVCGGVLSEAQQEEVTECNPKACQKPDNQKVVCGSDGLTYPNRCQLELVRCKNKGVVLSKRGPCKEQRSCLEWEHLSLDFPQYQFKSRCKKNYSYEPGQCHPESGYCWCVTPEGIPIPGTVKPKNTKLGSKPIRCGGGKKKIARSPNRHKPKSRNCDIAEKSAFNTNLINSFQSEYIRVFWRNASDEDIMRWKFNSLDVNRDSALDKREYRDVKRLVAKAMKPKKCAKAFPKSCDINSDSKISWEEWRVCLPRDGRSDGPLGENQDNGNDTGDDYETPYDHDNSKVAPDRVLSQDSSVVPSPGSSYDDEPVDSSNIDEISHGCLADRNNVLEEGNIGGHLHNATYIPDCTPDGRYKKVQCYDSVGYCWCVNEDDGTTIPGTSVKGALPNCDVLKVALKPMKGCPDEKKIVFLKELMPFLQTKIRQSLNSADSFGLIQNDLEQASFNFLDKNRNKILERVEWKAFKEMVALVKGLKKCGKKLPRYCDNNKDKQITLTEWRDCLNMQGNSSSVSPTGVRSSRLGKTNPLSMLKDD